MLVELVGIRCKYFGRNPYRFALLRVGVLRIQVSCVCICFLSFCPSHRCHSSAVISPNQKTHLLLFPYPITSPFPWFKNPVSCFPRKSLSLFLYFLKTTYSFIRHSLVFWCAYISHCPLSCEYVLLWCSIVCMFVGGKRG